MNARILGMMDLKAFILVSTVEDDEKSTY